tara:strand:- start:214 stop:441 length:228 start_codon:yes stop_codon:yes gene_type:complete
MTKKNKNSKYDLEHSKLQYKPDDRICVFYVAERLTDIVAMENGAKAHEKLWEFQEEILRNIGVDALHKHKGGELK